MKILFVTLVILFGAVAGVLLEGSYRWNARTRNLVARLFERGVVSDSPVYEEACLKDVPPVVARYFRAVLRNGQPIVRTARLEQRGFFLVRPAPDGWRPFVATDYFATHPTGFVWDARIRIGPALHIRVRDALVAGKGSMRASALSILPVVSVEGTPEITSGALHRYLAEAVWFPTALLPSQGVKWTALDDRSARATITVGTTTEWLDFRFGPDNLVSGIFAARFRLVNGHPVRTPWQGRFSGYAEQGGMRLPMAGEVEWLLPEGPQLYWRGEITKVHFEYEQEGQTIRSRTAA